jgi:DNA polymerase I
MVYGFCMMMQKIVDEFQPDALAVVFDSKGPTFRHKKFEDYKSHRKPMPDDLLRQMPVVKRMVEAYRVPQFEKQGFEADDIIGTMAKHLSDKGHNTVIVTGDKDLLQLVDGRVSTMNPQKDYFLYGPKEVKEKWGVSPKQIVDVLSLAGDASDFIPGVPGIGPKTATELVVQFKSLEGVLKNVDQVKGESKKKNIRDNEKQARLSYELATIERNVPMDFDLKDLKLKEPDASSLRALFKELEFRTLLKNLPSDGQRASVKKNYQLITKETDWLALLKKLKKHSVFAFDFETTGTNALLAEPVSISFSMKPHEASLVLFSIHGSKKSQLKARTVLTQAKELFEDSRIKKIGQNIKYEMKILRQFGIHLKGISFDTMVGSYILNPAKPNHNMSDIALEHLDEELTKIESLIGKGKSQISMRDADLESLVEYGCQDSDVTLRLSTVLNQKIKEKGMEELLGRIEMPLIEVLCDMEEAGIAIDSDFFVSLSQEMSESILKLSSKIHKMAGSDFNIKSTLQLREILFQKLGLPVLKKTKTGPSTDADVLAELSQTHALPGLILKYRALSKLKSTYADPMPDLVNPKTGRIHSSFNQTVTATGRLSSNEPNLQNIPIRTEEGRKIRKGFVAQKGKVLLSADYSQIELRVLAHFSKDKNLKRAFVEGQDVHVYTASLIFSVEPSKVTSKMRETAKTVNFGVLYGMSPFGLSKSLKITREAAKDFIESYFDRYTGVKSFLESTIQGARDVGYVETLFKRRRYIPDIHSPNVQVKQFAERTAINAPVQGTASDLIKLAMIAVHQDLSKMLSDARMILQVHDELVFEVEKKGLNDLARIVKKDMEGVGKLDVALEVKMKSGSNWMEMKPFTS